MAVDIKQASRQLFEEAWGKGRYEVFDELCDRTYRGHDPLAGELDTRGAKELCRGYREAFPDLACTFLGTFVEGDTCIIHWRMNGTHQRRLMNLEPTGKRCTVEGISVARFRAGKIVEDWTQWDALGLFRQLGVSPSVMESMSAPAERRPHA